MTQKLVCWKCGASIEELSQPLGRNDVCPACRTELHVCRQCRFHDPGIRKGCREPVAEEVRERERANFCGYFQLRPDAYTPRDTAASETALAQLRALFGDKE